MALVKLRETLTGYSDINKAMRIASAFDSGMVGVNCISLMMVSPGKHYLLLLHSADSSNFPQTQAPFGGSKQSGVGRESGIHALRAFTDPKTIMVGPSQPHEVFLSLADHSSGEHDLSVASGISIV